MSKVDTFEEKNRGGKTCATVSLKNKKFIEHSQKGFRILPNIPGFIRTGNLLHGNFWTPREYFTNFKSILKSLQGYLLENGLWAPKLTNVVRFMIEKCPNLRPKNKSDQ